MKKGENLLNQRDPKRTSKWLVVVIVVFSTILTILPIVAMVFMFMFFDFDEGIYDQFEENKYGEIVVDDDVRIYGVESYYDEVYNNYYIQGYLENLDDEGIEYVSVEYSLYDKNDVLLGSAYSEIDYLKANGKWKFKVIYSDVDSQEVVTYELSEVEFY